MNKTAYKWFALIASVLMTLSACDQSDEATLQLDLDHSAGIIGGSEVQANSPEAHYVAMISADERNLNNVCTATQVSENVLLTAAHCFPNLNLRDISVSYSSKKMKTQVKSLAIHPKYNPRDKSTSIYDLALVRVYGFAPDAQKIVEMSFEEPPIPSEMLAIGYGITNVSLPQGASGKGLGVLRSVKVQAFEIDNGFVKIDMRPGKGINGGDSGGPALFFRDGEPIIYGIAKSADRHTDDKGFEHFRGSGYYTMLQPHRDWILKTIEEWKF